jgi:O-methyltransferase domain
MEQHDSPAVGDGPPDSADDRLIQIGEMVFVAWALQVAATLGVPDAMSDRPRAVEEIASAAGVHAGALYRVLRLLGMHGVVHETSPRTFALTDLGEALRSDTPNSVRSWFVMNAPINRVLFEAPLDSLRSGGPAFARVMGAPFFEYAAVDQAWGAVFDQAMGDVGHRTAAAVATAYDFRGVRRVVDVGGGTGTLISAILRAQPDIRGVIFDLPEVADRARAALTASGLADRCEVIPGSFLEAVPSGGDVYVLSWIIHDWDDSRAIAILRNCRRAMPSTARLLLIESVMPEGDTPHLSKSMDIAMLVALGGQERTVPEYRALLGQSGLELRRVIPAGSTMSVFEAVVRTGWSEPGGEP